ncbi:MAG: ABC transporter ATP-binding protein [Actinobacteria bacterium]|nr:ABC transporter ATP-binding protein [Actinomycetota bacterium]
MAERSATTVRDVPPTRAGGSVRLEALSKSYGAVPAVRGIDLDVAAGEFFSLLGPSGCGKTTTLRLVAGFEQPDGGQVLIDGQDVSAVPPERRPVNTVFQSYALFPFMSVRDNVAFGLRYAGASKQETRQRVDEALALVQMSAYAGRRPAQLSGGQQQRVALARALVLGPRVLLLDEPLGALDAKLRKALQLELKSLQEAVGITFVYVTHDQDEALTMSDRIAVMSGGLVVQVGTPTEVYERPATAYVADFLGAANVVPVEVVGPDGDRTAFRLAGQVLVAGGPEHAPGPASLVVRPERLRLLTSGHAVAPAAPQAGGPPVPDANVLPATVARLVYRGAHADVVVEVGGAARFSVLVPADASSGLTQGGAVSLVLPPESLRLLPSQ